MAVLAVRQSCCVALVVVSRETKQIECLKHAKHPPLLSGTLLLSAVSKLALGAVQLNETCYINGIDPTVVVVVL